MSFFQKICDRLRWRRRNEALADSCTARYYSCSQLTGYDDFKDFMGQYSRSEQNAAEPFSLKNWETYAKCVKVYDGDSIHLVGNYEGQLVKFHCVLNGIRAPGIRGISNADEKNRGIEARDFLGLQIMDEIVRVKFHEMDPFSRFRVDVYTLTDRGMVIDCVNELMVRKGYASLMSKKSLA